MSGKIENIDLSEAGYIIIHSNSGPPLKLPIASSIRQADVPVVTYTQVPSLSALANLIVVLIRTLIDRGVLDESFLEDGDYNLDDIEATISELGGSYSEPDLTVETE